MEKTNSLPLVNSFDSNTNMEQHKVALHKKLWRWIEKVMQEVDKSEKFLTVLDVASMLSVRPSTVYQWVSSREIPHYRLGRIVRFKRKDLEVWIEDHREEKRIGEARKTREIFSSTGKETQDIDRIIKKSIEEVRGLNYTLGNGRPDRIKSLRREGQNGAI